MSGTTPRSQVVPPLMREELGDGHLQVAELGRSLRAIWSRLIMVWTVPLPKLGSPMMGAGRSPAARRRRSRRPMRSRG